MSRIKIDLPKNFSFTCRIPIRITDVNYGNHVGNDAILSLIHEARMQYLSSYGYSELNLAGAGLIMKDVGIEFKHEVFYGDTVIVSITSTGFTKVSFDIYYKLEKDQDGKRVDVAIAKTGMICYDYSAKKILAVPVEASEKLK